MKDSHQDQETKVIDAMKLHTWYSLKNVERKQRKVSEARTDMVYAARALARVRAVCILA